MKLRYALASLATLSMVVACSASDPDDAAPPRDEPAPTAATGVDDRGDAHAEPLVTNDDAGIAPPSADAAPAAPLPACPCFIGDGEYCGRNVDAMSKKAKCAVPQLVGHEGDVLTCKGGTWTVTKKCAFGCFAAPTGQPDGCHVQAPTYHLPWPCGTKITTTQGPNGDICGSNGGDHVGYQKDAFDFGTPRGTPILAARGGTVTRVVNASPPGSACNNGCPQPFGSAAFNACCNACINNANWVNVAHGDGTVATYWHLDQTLVAVGQVVKAGDKLGLAGTTGCSTGPHLHFHVMGNCPTTVCNSIPVTFDEAGAPACGFVETSQNACK